MEHDRDRHNCAICVLVADNSHFHTQLLGEVLKRDPDLTVVSSVLDPASVVAASITQKIDVFVLSAFADEDAQRGFKILQELRGANPDTRAVMLLNSSKPESVLAAFRAGARGVFDHRESSEMLCQCIHRVHEGQVWVNNDQMALVIDALASAPKLRSVGENGMNLLTRREAEVVRCLTEGLTNREIAERLSLSQHTVKNYLFRIFDKLGVSNRVELLFMTLSQGTAAHPLLQGLLSAPSGHCDQATLVLYEKAAERGILAAQLLLAQISWTGRRSDNDVIRAYLWFSFAFDQLNRTKNTVKKAMNPAQLAEAEREVRERLDKWQRIEPSLVAQTPSQHARSAVA